MDIDSSRRLIQFLQNPEQRPHSENLSSAHYDKLGSSGGGKSSMAKAELLAPELLLVSGSCGLEDRYITNEKRVSFDLVFDLSKKYRLHSPSLVEVWRNDISTPLRDRLMIEWVFFHPVAVKQLDIMIEEITEKLKDASTDREEGENSVTLSVAVTCSTGHQLSPCFVEKLYDHFSSPARNLNVKRHHHTILRALKTTHCRQSIWQYKHFKSKQRFFTSIHQLTGTVCTSLRWYDFSNAANTKIEQSFRDNPCSNSCVIDDLEVNFQDGTCRRITTNQFSYLRSIPRGSLKRYTVVAHPINHEQYKSYVKSHTYQAAGILPYAVHPVSGEAVFLLGKITYGTMTWCDFGGLKSHFPLLHMFQRNQRLSLRESPAETAARECCEETMGMLGDTATLLANIRDYKTNNVFKVINEEHNYVGHFLRVPYDSYPDQYTTILKHGSSSQPSSQIEVEMMRWVGMSALRSAVEEKLVGIENTSISPINEKDGSVDSTIDMHLRQEFVESLCVAEKLGVLTSITAITRKIHKVSQKDEKSLLTECKDLEDEDDEENESEELDTATEQDLTSSPSVTDSSDHCSTNASSSPISTSDESTVATAQLSNSQRQENCDKEHARHRRRGKRRKGGVDIAMYGMGSGSVVIAT